MRLRSWIAGGLSLVLAACGPATDHKAFKKSEDNGGAVMGQAAPSAPADAEGAPRIITTSGAQGGVPVAGAMLAYTYNAGLTLPFEHVRATMAAHEKVCVDAGPAVCQVLESSVEQPLGDVVNGVLHLRARPDFATDFAATLEGDAAKLKGRIEQSRTSEDLTRQIIDTEASLRAKTTLRDRLQALLRDRPGRLSDLLETEQALANVQQEIDSAQSYLAEMRQRVATSKIVISYGTLPTGVGGGAFDPLGEAFTGFFRVSAYNLAAIITAIAALLPWFAIGGPLVWFGWRLLKSRLPRAQKPPTSQGEPGT